LIEFTSLASSSAGCCYRLATGNSAILLDCGLPYSEIQKALNFEVSKLDGCLITHCHGDHIKAANDLMRAGVDCYAHLETWREYNAGGHRMKPCRVGVEFRVGEWRIKAFEAVHDVPGSVGFYMVGGGKQCVYLTDSAYNRYAFPGITHLFVECNHSVDIMRANTGRGDMSVQRYRRTRTTHMALETLEAWLVKTDRSSLEEIHLLHLSDGNSDEQLFRERIGRLTGVPVYIAAKKSEVPF
jgi:phosphoribosyl 1,2-cyclic phosphodiesterase